MRLLLLFAFVLAAPAQQPGEWDFLSDPSVFPDVHGMLPAYLKSRAFAMLDQRKETISHISTMSDLEARRQRVRERIWSYLGGRPARTPLNARIAGTLDRGDYTVEKIIFESRPHFYVTANLYLPKAGKAPYPAILFPLGHERGAKAHSAWQQCLAGFARRGFVALAWDPIGQGERVQFYDEDWHGSKLQGSTVEHSILGMQSLLMGTHVAQYTIWDGIRALDYLVSRPEVDPKRVGCTGNSGGGTHTAYLSALDDRIQVAAPSCYITSWRRMLESIGPQDGEQVFPFFLRDGFDYPDFLYAFLGKPFLMLTAIRDFFPIGGARSTFAEAKEVFGRLGLASQVAMFEADDGHGYSKPRREAAYRWFTRWLQGKENDSPEAPLTLASEEELQCAPTGQVKTSIPDATDVFTLNLETARRLRAGRTFSPEAIRARAREVTGYETHAGRPLQITSYGHLTRPACRVEKLTLQSEPGILLPALLFLPEDGPQRKPAILLADGKGKAAAASDAEALAGKGYVVLAPDLRGFGETEPALDRRDYFVRNFGDYESAWNALLTGKTMPGMRAGDVTRGIDLLAGRTDVDSARLYVIGRGGAATAALFAALFDGRIRSLLVEGMLSSYESVVTERILQGNVDQMTPSALRYFDLPAIAAALAPRRVGVFNAVNPLGQELPLSRLKKEYAGLPATVEIGVRPREQPFLALAERFARR